MPYEQQLVTELEKWKKEMMKPPSPLDRFSKRVQVKMNSYIPEKVHRAITVAIRQMIRAVLFGRRISSGPPAVIESIRETEAEVEKLVSRYRRTAAVEGGITGAGGILMGIADFPILLGIKLSLLFDLGRLYGFDLQDYRERIFLLHIFQLAFSSPAHRREVFVKISDWENEKHQIPTDIGQFDWRSFQQEYRDYIDIAKIAQLVPGVGAVVGLVVNSRLISRLARTAMNAYRMRLQALNFF